MMLTDTMTATDVVAHSIWKHQRKLFRRTDVAKQERREYRRKRAAKERRMSQWIAIVYVLLALATPLLLYDAPPVLSPAAPEIAEKAMDGDFTVRTQPVAP